MKTAINPAIGPMLREFKAALQALYGNRLNKIILCALLTESIVTKKHEGARVKFHELFIKTGRFTREAGLILKRNFEARQSADYGMEAELNEE